MHVSARTGERGFTMVELLVVILIIGILAMVALPAFLSQRIKGEDTDAQTTVRTVATAAMTFHTDRGTYDASIEELVRIEPAIADATDELKYEGTTDTFEITETSDSHTDFTLRHDDGTTSRSCTIPDRGLCNGVGEW